MELQTSKQEHSPSPVPAAAGWWPRSKPLGWRRRCGSGWPHSSSFCSEQSPRTLLRHSTRTLKISEAQGFAPAPAAGQLDSDLWIVTGLSDGVMTFGDTRTTGDFARGVSSGAVGIGGVYAFNTGLNRILGVQPGTDDFTPGTIRLRLVNTSTSAQTTLHVAYKIWYRNDQDRSSYLHLAYA